MNHKKHLFLAVFLSVFSNTQVTLANTNDPIGSPEECRSSLGRTYQGTGTYPVAGSRLDPVASTVHAALLFRLGAEVRIENDELGVPRYRTILTRRVMEQTGDASDACVGITTATLVELCTTEVESSLEAACETFCQVDWQGQDCR